jgi:fumarylacetoacetate (FAA) hydrolase family protein
VGKALSRPTTVLGRRKQSAEKQNGPTKDNNASCAIGPLLGFFDASFSLDAVYEATVNLSVVGTDGFQLDDVSYLNRINSDTRAISSPRWSVRVGATLGNNVDLRDVDMTGTQAIPLLE